MSVAIGPSAVSKPKTRIKTGVFLTRSVLIISVFNKRAKLSPIKVFNSYGAYNHFDFNQKMR